MLRRTLLLLLAAVCFACSGGDDDSGSSSSSSSDETSDSTAPPANAAGFTEEVRTRFVSSCVEGGATEGYCQCAIDEIAATVPLTDFAAFEASVLASPDATVPDAIAAALASCT